ncbi:PQQ-dependent sugar dehydrogenase [Hymenobacter humi]|uniref:PQQ-dependent sugar dehydrogenase n=1 Tax=Hymenobacter humi TaxID=1411620 RepID=A0ABW2U9V2_9BACT
MRKNLSRYLLLSTAIAGSATLFALKAEDKVVPDADNAGLKLPSGFGALVVAETGGRARHLTVTPQGLIYVKLNRPNAAGKGILMLRPSSNGKATVAGGLGNYGGTGIYSNASYLYASSDQEVFRYKLNKNGEVASPAQPEKIITGLINRRQHESKSITLDKEGNLYVNIGAYSNTCQEKDRQKGSLGKPNCPILDSAGGIWQFRADKLNQTYGNGTRYATGLRNVVGLDWNTQANQLFVMQHGRDQLSDNFPDLYTTKQSAELPAECMYALKKGDNAGWPYLYYDPMQKKKCWAPSTAATARRKPPATTSSPPRPIPPTRPPTPCCSTPAPCSPRSTATAPSSPFTAPGTGRPSPRRATTSCFSHLKTASPPATGRCSRIISPARPRRPPPAAPNTSPAAWPKAPMAQSMSPTIRRAPFTALFTPKSNPVDEVISRPFVPVGVGRPAGSCPKETSCESQSRC